MIAKALQPSLPSLSLAPAMRGRSNDYALMLRATPKIEAMLLCTVRSCGMALVRDGRQMLCPRGHAFDIARSGYINLLQPQDRRAKRPGDSADVTQARSRLHQRGVTAPLLDKVGEMLTVQRGENVLDAGCGDGFYLGSLARSCAFRGHGIDISTAAVDAAARCYPECEWVVANADRFVPYADASFSAVLSITARMNSSEFRRVLRNAGRLLVAVPAPDDLEQLRTAARSRVARTVATFTPHFTLLAEERATASADLDPAGVRDVFRAIYRPLGAGPHDSMRVTLSLDLLLFAAK